MLNKSIEFLSNLAKNNNRDWFQENKPIFEEAKKEFEEFSNILIAKIAEFDPDMKDVDAKKSIFRIYRDTRFAKDKTPYKTNFGVYIVAGGRKSPLAGYYLHIEPNGKSFIGGGVHSPEPKILKAIRDDIYHDASQIKEIVNSGDFITNFGEIVGDKLKTAPKGFPKDFEDIELLRYKSYAQVHELDNKLFMEKDFIEKLIVIYKKAKPLNDYLNKIVKEAI